MSCAYWIRDCRCINLGDDEYHHNAILKHPEEFLSEREISDFCNCFGLDSLEDLLHDVDFQEECGDEWEELTSLVLSKGWIKVRQGNFECWVTCYTLPHDKDKVMVAMYNYPDAFSREITVGDYIHQTSFHTRDGINGAINYLVDL